MSRAVAINLRGREEGARPELDDVASLRAANGGSSRSYVGLFNPYRTSTGPGEYVEGFKPDTIHDALTKNPAPKGPPLVIPPEASGDRSIYDPQPDGRRYAACGDGVVANVAEWIGRRLVEVAA